MRDLLRKTVVLQVGGALGMVVQALAGVFMARLLQPEGYAEYALAFSVASLASLFIGAAVTDAITPQFTRAWARGDGATLRDTVGFFVRFLVACSAATAVVALLLPMITARLYHNPLLGGYAAVIVVASIISTTIFCLTQLSLQVAGRMQSLAVLTLADVVARYGAMLALVAGGFGIWGAATGHLVGAVVMLIAAAILYTYLERTHLLLPRLRTFITAARHASWQPLVRPTLWVLADRGFAMLYGALPIAMVGLSVSGAPLAYFKLAFGYVILAMSVMGPVSTVLNVHFPTLQTAAPHELRKQFIRVSLTAIALSALITLMILVAAPFVFRILYGPAYVPAVQYVYGFGIFGALFGLGAGLGPMWRALGKVRTSILINAITLGIGIPLGFWMIHAWGIAGAVVMVTAWYTFSHAVSFAYLVRALPDNGSSVRMGT